MLQLIRDEVLQLLLSLKSYINAQEQLEPYNLISG
jgi:hypothetical protein